MINFGSFSDNHPSQSTIDSSTICTSVSRRSNIKLDFDEETPRNSALQAGPSRHMANIFLRKERKNLSDSTPSRSQMKNINPQYSSNLQDLFLKSQNDCTESSDGLKATGTFLPRLGSSESLETDKISIQDQLSEANPQTLTELHEEQLLAEIPLATSIQRHAHRSFTECFARTKLPANTKSKQKSVAEVSDRDDSFQNKLSLSVSKNLRDPDLTTISAQTVANLIRESPSSSYLIVDCRFSYEYQGGKIKGAINVTSLEMLEKIFFTHKDLLYNPRYIEDLKKDTTGTLEKVDSYINNENSEPLNSKLPLVIFHCEFSQKRGPRAFRALRNTDRQKNLKTWPRLDFPEIYILEGGFSAFFSEFAEFCEGTYVKMVEKTHRIEYAIAKDNDKKLWGKKYVVEYN